MDELGYTDTDGDGVRNLSEGQPLEFTLTYDSDSAIFTDIATILQNDFGQAGVRVNLQGVQGSSLFGTALAGDFEAILVAFGNQPDPELRKPIWQPGGSLYYWHRATQPSEEGGQRQHGGGGRVGNARVRDFQRSRHADRPVSAPRPLRRVAAAQCGERTCYHDCQGANVASVYNRVQNFVYSLGVIPGYNPLPLYFISE